MFEMKSTLGSIFLVLALIAVPGDASSPAGDPPSAAVAAPSVEALAASATAESAAQAEHEEDGSALGMVGIVLVSWAGASLALGIVWALTGWALGRPRA